MIDDPQYGYYYRCEQCRTTSPIVASRDEVESERNRHRRFMHGGHIPDGELIHTPPPRPGQPTKPIHYVAYAAAAILVVLIGLARHAA